MEKKGGCPAPQSLSGTQAPPIGWPAVLRSLEASNKSCLWRWQISKERKADGEIHTEGFYEPGLGVAYITFTHIPRVRLH